MGTAITYIILTLVLGLVCGIIDIWLSEPKKDSKGNLIKDNPFDKIKFWIVGWGIIFGFRLILYFSIGVFR